MIRFLLAVVVLFLFWGCSDSTEPKAITSTVTDIDGNIYQTKKFGDQIWMIENLKVTHYNNNDSIRYIYDGDFWANTFSGAYCVYQHNPEYGNTFGNLYNWYAVNDERGLAPEGWHIPTDEEWMELEMFIGMTESEAYIEGLRGTNEGSKLAGRMDLWEYGYEYDMEITEDPEFGLSGFEGLPGGSRDDFTGSFGYMGGNSAYWTSTESSNYLAWLRVLHYEHRGVWREHEGKSIGFYLRCVKD